MKKANFRVAPLFFLILFVFLSKPAFPATAFSSNPQVKHIVTLKEAYRLAALKNGTIKATKEIYYQSTLLKWSAISMYLPDINFRYADQRFHANIPPTPPAYQSPSTNYLEGQLFTFFYPNYEYSFTLNQPLLDLSVIPAYNAARNSALSEKSNLNGVSADTLYNVAVSYYMVLNDESLIKADKKTYEEAKAHLELTRAKLRAGLAIITDILQAKSQYYSAKQGLISGKNSLKTSKARLASLMGIDYDFSVVSPPEPFLAKKSLKNYIAEAYRNNPGLKALNYSLETARNETGYYESQYIPKINFQASFNEMSNTHFIPAGSPNYWTAGAYLTMPLFQGGTRIISIEKARSESNEALYNMVQSRRDLRAQVISDFYNVKNLREEVVTLKYEESFASKNYSLVEEEYKAGVATSVDVITALANLVRARHMLLSAKRRYYDAILNLKRLTGTFQNRLISVSVVN